MLRGLYTAALGMRAQMRRLDVVTDNLANLETPGFKRSLALLLERPGFGVARVESDAATGWPAQAGIGPVPSGPFAAQPIGRLGLGVQMDAVATDWSQGPIQETGNPLDLAIEGDGFFVVQTLEGLRYTRSGNFRLDGTGRLVTQAGEPVLGYGGPIYLEGPVTVDRAGRLLSNGQEVDQLLLVSFDDPTGLAREAGSLYRAPDGDAGRPAEAAVRQGALERSNADAAAETVNLISASRIYEANQRAVQAHDQLLDRLWNEVARV